MGAASLMGSGIMAGGKIAGGYAQQRSDNYAAAVLQQEAGASVASGIQGAIMDRRQANYIASSAQARAAAGGVTGPTVSNVESQIQQQGEYKALTSVYQGEDRAQEIRTRAVQLKAEGSAAVESGWMSGMSNVLQGGVSFYNKYHGGDTTNPSYS